jgi:hypothetical protein
VAGRWTAAVEGRPATALALSTRGGLLETAPAPATGTKLRVEIDFGEGRTPLSLAARAVRVEGRRVAVEWEQPDGAMLAALGDVVVARLAEAAPAVEPRPQALRAAR